jgi:hypothetical protein
MLFDDAPVIVLDLARRRNRSDTLYRGFVVILEVPVSCLLSTGVGCKDG